MFLCLLNLARGLCRDTVGVHKVFPVLDEEVGTGLPHGWNGSLEGLNMEFDVRPSASKGDSTAASLQARLIKGQQVYSARKIEFSVSQLTWNRVSLHQYTTMHQLLNIFL